MLHLVRKRIRAIVPRAYNIDCNDSMGVVTFEARTICPSHTQSLRSEASTYRDLFEAFQARNIQVDVHAARPSKGGVMELFIRYTIILNDDM